MLGFIAVLQLQKVAFLGLILQSAAGVVLAEGSTPCAQEMSQAEFLRNRDALISNKRMKFTNLGEETDFLWDKVYSRWYAFGARELEAEALESITLEDVQVAPSHPWRFIRRGAWATLPESQPGPRKGAAGHLLATVLTRRFAPSGGLLRPFMPSAWRRHPIGGASSPSR